MTELKIKRLNKNAIIPTRATEGSCGYDLHAFTDEAIIIEPKQRKTIHTGIAIALPNINSVALIYARSGIATKFGIIPANCVGVVDSDYRGEIMVTLTNLSDSAYSINNGDRIAQMVITPVYLPQLIEVDELENTLRDKSGFGSTGV